MERLCTDAVTYQGVGDDLVLQKDRGSHLGVVLCVMVDKSLVGDAVFLLDHDGDLCDLAKPSGVGIASGEDHGVGGGVLVQQRGSQRR